MSVINPVTSFSKVSKVQLKVEMIRVFIKRWWQCNDHCTIMIIFLSRRPSLQTLLAKVFLKIMSFTCALAWLCAVLMVPLMLFIWALDTKKTRINRYWSYGWSWKKIPLIFGVFPSTVGGGVWLKELTIYSHFCSVFLLLNRK